MRTLMYFVAISLAINAAVGQDTNRQQNDSKSSSGMQTQNGKLGQTAQTYKGTLVDASCTTSGTGTTPANASAPDAAQQRSETKSQPGTCSVSSNTNQFALKLDDGRTVPFDSVGNLRVLQALKDKKKWNEAAGAGKPIRAKVSGFMADEKLMLLSIN